jgi:pimeloyl-ACP methyl ester carboxylesterase
VKRVAVTAVAAVLGLTGIGLGATAGAQTQSAQSNTASNTAQAVAAGVAWKPCTEEGLEGMECATLQVPLDYKNPKGTKISIALSRFKHTGPDSGFQGVLLTNPGGPGGEGRSFAAGVASDLPENLQQAYDVIGFDPRGVAASDPSLTCDPDYFLPVRPDYVPVTRGLEATWLKRSAGYAKACGDKWGSVLKHMTTIDAVKDMESIRAALGQSKINYYGASYGTYLGGVYATLFPTHVRRMVLDSIVRPSGVWYDDNLDQDVAFDKNLNALFGWIAKYDSVYHLGTTEKVVRDFYYATRAKLIKTPAGGVVGGDEIDDTFLVAGYIDLGPYWPFLANALAQYKAGNAQALVEAYNTLGLVTDDNGFAVYSAVQCSDVQWPTDWGKWRRDNWKVYDKAPFVTWGNAWFNAPCAFWPVKGGNPVKFKTNPGLPQILLTQATDDGPTPLPGALEVHRIFKGSRLVIEDGGRTHGVVQRGNACIDDKFNAFLADGSLPAQNTVHCDRLPEPVPPSSGATTLKSAQKSGFPRLVGRPAR